MAKKIRKRKPVETKPAEIIETKSMMVKDLRVFHKNPNVSDVDAIAKSLHHNGQFRAIIVNVGTHTGRPNEVLGGNHTLLAARKELTWRDVDGKSHHKMPYEQILAHIVDVDEAQAVRINIADNRTHKGGEIDEDLESELLWDAGISLDGLGLSDDEAQALTSDWNRIFGDKSTDDVNEEIESMREDLERETEKVREKGEKGSESDDDTDPDLEDIEPEAELQIVLEHRINNLYLGENAWGIPDLLPDMLVQALPSNTIQCWGGEKATPDDGEKWFLYNYRMGERAGMPFDRTILAFNSHDYKFANWWEKPAFYTAQYMSAGVPMVVVPDFSFYGTESRAHHLWNVYRAQWMGRFFQDAGWKVIPRLQFDYTDPDSLDIALLGIPRGLKVLATSQQNFDKHNPEEHWPLAAQHLQNALDELQPDTLLYYSGNPGRRLFEERVKFDGEVIFVENYASVRRGAYFDKDAGKKRLKKRQIKAIKKKHQLEDPEIREQYSEDDEIQD